MANSSRTAHRSNSVSTTCDDGRHSRNSVSYRQRRMSRKLLRHDPVTNLDPALLQPFHPWRQRRNCCVGVCTSNDLVFVLFAAYTSVSVYPEIFDKGVCADLG